MSVIDIRDELEDERAVLVRGTAGPWPAGAALRLPGEEVRFEASPREWVRPGLATAGLALALLGAALALAFSPLPSPCLFLGLVPALLAALEAARTARWRSTRYVVTTARVLVVRGIVRPSVVREVSRSRATFDAAVIPPRVVSPTGTIDLVGLDAASIAALAVALDDPRAARGVDRSRFRRSKIVVAGRSA